MEHAPQHVEVLDPVDRLLHAAALLGGGAALATGPLLEVPALAAALATLAADPARRLRLGQAARVLSADYTWDRRAARLDDAFSAAVSA